jgi:hypothetical protein
LGIEIFIGSPVSNLEPLWAPLEEYLLATGSVRGNFGYCGPRDTLDFIEENWSFLGF